MEEFFVDWDGIILIGGSTRSETDKMVVPDLLVDRWVEERHGMDELANNSIAKKIIE